MLFDRFDNMRSKIMQGGGSSGEYDFDLSRIGTTVTVTPTSNINKGDLWVGERNSNADYEFYNTNIGANPPYYTDLYNKVGFTPDGSDFIKSNTTSLPIYFYDNGWEISNIDLSTIVPQLGIDTLENNSINYTVSFGLSENGKLLILKITPTSSPYDYDFAGKNKIVIVEIDSINKTTTPRIFTLHDITKFNYIFGNYIVSSFLITGYTFGLQSYYYDMENHSLNYIASTGPITNIDFLQYYTIHGFEGIAWVNSSTVAVHPAYDNQYAVYLWVFELTQSTFSANMITLPLTSNKKYNLSGDGRYVTNMPSYNVTTIIFYEIDYTNLSYTTFTTTISFQATGRLVYGNKLIVNYSSTLYLYEIINNDIQLIKSFTSPFANYSLTDPNCRACRFFNINLLSLFRYGAYLWKIATSNAEYIISPNNGGQISSDKFYGISSKKLSLGDVDNAQLLWNSLTS